MKVSLIIPVYYNENNLESLYQDLEKNFIQKITCEYEFVFVDDGSKDESFRVLQELKKKNNNIKLYKLSRNFGSHAAILCGLSKATGDCAIIKAADLQEPTELLIDMIEKWKEGYNVVLAQRESREEGFSQQLFANMYYFLVRKTALSNMPQNGFDIYLIDKKVIKVLEALDEKNSALTGQILWSGFKTGTVQYTRLERKVGKSKWTLKKKIKLVLDTLFSFSTLPITVVLCVGTISFFGSIFWAIFVFMFKIMGKIDVNGWTTLFIFNLFSFGTIMLTLGVIGEYLWRTFDASRKRPPYIIEEEIEEYE